MDTENDMADLFSLLGLPKKQKPALLTTNTASREDPNSMSLLALILLPFSVLT